MFGLLVRGRWILIDQVLSSGANFVLAFVLVRSVEPREFGAFGVALVTFQLIISLGRAQGSEPLTIRYSDVGKKEWARAAAHSTGYSLVLGLLGGAGMIAFGLTAGGALRTSFLVMGLVLPALLVQDGWRYAFFTLGSPARAVANDLVLTVVQGVVLVFLAATGTITIAGAIAAWGLAALVAAVLGCVQARTVPSMGHSLSWLRETRMLGGALTGDLIARGAASQVALFAIGALAGLASVGYVRAGLLLFGPLYALIQGAVPFAVSECVRLKSASPHRLRPTADLLSLLFGAGGLLLGAVLLLLPENLGRAFLGSSWDGTRELLPAMTALAVTAGVIVGPAVGLRAIAAVGRMMTVSLVVAPAAVALPAAGALLAGAEGAAWGLAASNAVMAGALLWQFRTANRVFLASPPEMQGLDPEPEGPGVTSAP